MGASHEVGDSPFERMLRENGRAGVLRVAGTAGSGIYLPVLPPLADISTRWALVLTAVACIDN